MVNLKLMIKDQHPEASCLRIYDIALTTVPASFPQPVLWCQCLFTFCIVLNDKLPLFDQYLNKSSSGKC